MSTITFDPGDMADLRRIFLENEPPQLSQVAFEQLVIALKGQEILAPNLPLLWRVPAVDGFDGGVLPLGRYLGFLSLFIADDQLVPDGRLREQVAEMPDTRLLNLLNAQYVITDKVRDLWFDGVYYDRQIGARLKADHPVVEIDAPLPFSATHIDLIGAVAGDSEQLATLQRQNQAVGLVTLHADDGTASQVTLSMGAQPGADFADDALNSEMALASKATVAYRDVEGGRQEYRARLALPTPTTPLSLTVKWLADSPDLLVQAVTLFDQRLGMFSALPSDRGRFSLVHSGDVKVYENLDVTYAHLITG